ncbi:hypothetical protein F5Y18DRAFT_378187 [Xylariaceae sp. FL1019]|nr:hypothetical protein F5Y18DRAFT_378187 [Xylariaceae sp. FL1019]
MEPHSKNVKPSADALAHDAKLAEQRDEVNARERAFRRGLALSVKLFGQLNHNPNSGHNSALTSEFSSSHTIAHHSSDDESDEIEYLYTKPVKESTDNITRGINTIPLFTAEPMATKMQQPTRVGKRAGRPLEKLTAKHLRPDMSGRDPMPPVSATDAAHYSLTRRRAPDQHPAVSMNHNNDDFMSRIEGPLSCVTKAREAGQISLRGERPWAMNGIKRRDESLAPSPPTKPPTRHRVPDEHLATPRNDQDFDYSVEGNLSNVIKAREDGQVSMCGERPWSMDDIDRSDDSLTVSRPFRSPARRNRPDQHLATPPQREHEDFLSGIAGPLSGVTEAHEAGETSLRGERPWSLKDLRPY